MTHATTKISVYDTLSNIYDEFARVYQEQENSGTRWISFKTANGVEVTLFASPYTVDEPVAEAAISA